MSDQGKTPRRRDPLRETAGWKPTSKADTKKPAASPPTNRATSQGIRPKG